MWFLILSTKMEATYRQSSQIVTQSRSSQIRGIMIFWMIQFLEGSTTSVPRRRGETWRDRGGRKGDEFGHILMQPPSQSPHVWKSPRLYELSNSLLICHIWVLIRQIWGPICRIRDSTEFPNRVRTKKFGLDQEVESIQIFDTYAGVRWVPVIHRQDFMTPKNMLSSAFVNKRWVSDMDMSIWYDEYRSDTGTACVPRGTQVTRNNHILDFY